MSEEIRVSVYEADHEEIRDLFLACEEGDRIRFEAHKVRKGSLDTYAVGEGKITKIKDWIRRSAEAEACDDNPWEKYSMRISYHGVPSPTKLGLEGPSAVSFSKVWF